MACPDGQMTSALFQTAAENLNLWDMGFCAYAGPLGELVVGTVIYAGFAMHLFVRNGNLIIPFVLALILGSTVMSQMLGVINQATGLVILFSAPIAVTVYVYAMTERI